MGDPDHEALRRKIESGDAVFQIRDLTTDDLPDIAWSGSPAHLESVALQLDRAAASEVDYLAVFVDGHPVCKGGIDLTEEPGTALVFQVATHGALEGLGFATRLMRELELRAARRGITTMRLGVEPENERALRLYEHLGYGAIGSSEASWEAQRSDGTRFLYTTTIVEMSKPIRG